MKNKTKFKLQEQIILDVFFRTVDKFLLLWQQNDPSVTFDTWLKLQAEEYNSLKKSRKEKK